MHAIFLLLSAVMPLSAEPSAARAIRENLSLRVETQALILDQITNGLTEPAALARALEEVAEFQRLHPREDVWTDPSMAEFQSQAAKAFDRFFPDLWWKSDAPIPEADQALVRLLRRTQHQTGLFTSGTVLYDGRLGDGVGKDLLEHARAQAVLLQSPAF